MNITMLNIKYLKLYVNEEEKNRKIDMLQFQYKRNWRS